ncbi:helix-turn-helix transcriptional regulator [Ferruginibacter sp.]
MIDNTSILNEIIGGKICNLRKLNEDSQVNLSEKIKISRSSISNIEAGRQAASLSLLYEISQVYQSEIFSLLPTVQELNHYLEEGDNKFNEHLKSSDINDETRQQILNLIK